MCKLERGVSVLWLVLAAVLAATLRRLARQLAKEAVNVHSLLVILQAFQLLGEKTRGSCSLLVERTASTFERDGDAGSQ